MAQEQHNMLITNYTYDHLDVSGSQIVEIESKDMIKNYMWRFRRSDAYLNEWSNYTIGRTIILNLVLSLYSSSSVANPGKMFVTGNIGIKDTETGLITNDYPMNIRDIMVDLVFLWMVFIEKKY